MRIYLIWPSLYIYKKNMFIKKYKQVSGHDSNSLRKITNGCWVEDKY